MQEMVGWVSGAVATSVAVTLAWFRNARARRAISRLISGSVELDEQTSRAVSVSIAALQASLDRSLSEHADLAKQLSELRLEVSQLRARDLESTAIIAELQAEIVELREENCQLKKRLEEMGS